MGRYSNQELNYWPEKQGKCMKFMVYFSRYVNGDVGLGCECSECYHTKLNYEGNINHILIF